MAKTGEPILKVIATNRKATHDFHIHERIEAGIALVGSEVKSLREARVTMADGYVEIRKGQAYMHGIQINEYAQAYLAVIRFQGCLMVLADQTAPRGIVDDGDATDRQVDAFRFAHLDLGVDIKEFAAHLAE